MNDQWQTAAFAELTTAQLYALLRLRQAVFVVEQNCAYRDLDDLDHQAVHMFLLRNQGLIAYQRCLAPGICYRESALGRIVVDGAHRGTQLGRELVQRGIDYNQTHWPQSAIRINAQAHLQTFYASLGFVAEGPEHIEDGIAHRYMVYSESFVQT